LTYEAAVIVKWKALERSFPFLFLVCPADEEGVDSGEGQSIRCCRIMGVGRGMRLRIRMSWGGGEVRKVDAGLSGYETTDGVERADHE
jgi:hypothetical protein